VEVSKNSNHCLPAYLNYFKLKNSFSALSSSEAGLFLSTVFYFTSFAFGIFQSTETENLMSSVQRVIEYGQLPSEAPLESASGMLCSTPFFNNNQILIASCFR